ncbi:MAG: hypothetical protein KC635_12460, partial [Myxococcales bacterium]|nr:hypothetical protein [Myxococcales bacterium]
MTGPLTALALASSACASAPPAAAAEVDAPPWARCTSFARGAASAEELVARVVAVVRGGGEAGAGDVAADRCAMIAYLWTTLAAAAPVSLDESLRGYDETAPISALPQRWLDDVGATPPTVRDVAPAGSRWAVTRVPVTASFGDGGGSLALTALVVDGRWFLEGRDVASTPPESALEEAAVEVAEVLDQLGDGGEESRDALRAR